MDPLQKAAPQLDIDPLVYFIPPEDVLRRLNALSHVYRLASLTDSMVCHVKKGTLEITGMEYDRGTIIFETSPSGIRLELSSFDLDDINAFKVNSEFVLTRGIDDSAWTVEEMPFMENEDFLQRFEYLTDIFHMNARFIHITLLDSIIYEGQEPPQEFISENITKILESSENSHSA